MWMTTHTFGTKRKPEHHLSVWHRESTPGHTLVASDINLYLDHWELGVRAFRPSSWDKR